MRRSIPALVMVAIVVTAAQPAGAVDNEFRGWYQITARQTLSGCPKADYERRLRVIWVNDRERQFGPYRRHVSYDFDAARHFIYVSGKYFPWQKAQGGRFVLRYDPATDSAVGVRRGPRCRWPVRLVPIGPPSKG